MPPGPPALVGLWHQRDTAWTKGECSISSIGGRRSVGVGGAPSDHTRPAKAAPEFTSLSDHGFTSKVGAKQAAASASATVILPLALGPCHLRVATARPPC